ncbi:Phospholipase/carboxylesterase/thioesterase [Penicillium griseofulvum]|uniref:Phospholipase/carboxylesterase/thioesterase n=1 Tax=Penicillium patulum TaxID=5078 RepID=A0A135LL29_PENPA|nr:Phospholipase/carboxylesterase/thioesterase [Penicillium griseofulvum]KXG49677.1 Phospholipase/carboxylesterase/thioesterase [Penicillium griseofulvum]
MPTKTPTPSDFPSDLTVTVTPPPSPSQSTTPAPNILLLLHGLGDTAASFTKFAEAIRLPETIIVTIQGTAPLPFDLGGFHWGDDVSFDSATGALDMDAGLTRSTKTLVSVVRETLVQKCGYALREIMMLGFGQGGMAALAVARELGLKGNGNGEVGTLSGVISIGAPYPLSGSRAGDKNRSPVLLVAGRDSVAVSDEANMAYNLSIEVFGPGDSPTHRSHWGFMINKPGNLEFGDLLQVEVIDSDRLWYGFAPRYATKIIDKAAVGMCKIADLTSQQRHDAIKVIEKEPAPRDSIGRCQDWTFDALLSLEIEELVPSGTSEFWKGMIGRPAREVAAACGTNWTAF